MTKATCEYAIIRFAPFLETGEFANVGIVLIAPEQGFFGYLIEVRRTKRITDFFDRDIAKTLYRNTVHTLRNELERIGEMVAAHGETGSIQTAASIRAIFTEIIRQRESIVRFSKPRLVLADEPRAELERLFGYFIERSFVDKEYAEQRLNRHVHGILSAAHLDTRFKEATLGDDVYHVSFPFAERKDDQYIRAIKPLHLARENPSRLIDHATHWGSRVEELRRRAELPKHILFAVDAPDSANEQCYSAYLTAVSRLKDKGAEVAEYNDRDKLLAFAS